MVYFFIIQAPLVNYINHDSMRTNVELRWSSSKQHDIHNPKQMTVDDVKRMRHAGLMLEFVATKSIQHGDEIFLNYGQTWEDAWYDHVQSWTPPVDFEKDHTLVYPYLYENVTEVIRTNAEQQTLPYPESFFTSCYYNYQPNKSKNAQPNAIRWNETKTTIHDEYLRPCMILDRFEYNNGLTQEHLYTVGIQNRFGLNKKQRVKGRHIVSHVPRHAIRFSSKIYTTDQHLEGAFRHEIHVPEGIYPDAWLDL